MQTLKRYKAKIYMIIIILLFQVALSLLTAMVENSYAVETENIEAENTEESSLPSKFTLKDVIPENIYTKDQGSTSSCWAFAGITSLETNLALKDYYNGFVPKVYDFSERHLEHATTRKFLNNEINEYGFNRALGDGGTCWYVTTYLSNGLGAINEEDMPFENNKNKTYLSNIQDKTVTARVIDTMDFYPYYNDGKITEEEMQEMKNHIMNYGSIYASINYDTTYMNTSTNAYYTTKDSTNHVVSIIGWDDDYSVSNFKTGYKPSSPGAWIAKNSYVSYEYIYISYEYTTMYSKIFGIMNATTNVDYDNIYQYDIFGGSKTFEYSEDKKLYLANIFERETTDIEYLTEVSVHVRGNEIYNCRVYVNPTGTSKIEEDLIEVELKEGDKEALYRGYHTLEFKEPVELTGEEFAVVIELEAENGDSVSVFVESANATVWYSSAYSVVEVESGKCFYGGESAFEGTEEWVDFATKSADSTIKAFTTYTIKDDSLKEIVVTTAPEKTEYIEGQSFDETGMVVSAVFNNGVTRELLSGENAKYVIENGEVLSLEKPVTVSYTYEGETFTAEVPITVNRNKAVSLEITKEPDTVEYYEGKSFAFAGLEITATLLDGTKKVVEDYKVENGENLQYGQETVTISYDEVTVEVKITVKEKVLESIEITKTSAKTTYIEGQNFEADGMEVTATYNSGDTKIVTNYKVIDGENLTVGKNSVTISYTEDATTKTTMQSITVEAKKLESIKVTNVPNKTTYIEGDTFEDEGMEVTATYNNGDTRVVTDYKVTDGENLVAGKTSITISYTENGITKTVEQEITVLEKLKITFEEYEEINQDNKNHIKHIKVNETIEEMKENITTNGEIKVYQGEEEITNAKEKLATGMRVKITLREESKEYVAIVSGDANGDGQANLHDILAINKHRLNKTLLEGEYLLAGDIDGNGKVDLNDILKINRYRLGKIENL